MRRRILAVSADTRYWLAGAVAASAALAASLAVALPSTRLIVLPVVLCESIIVVLTRGYLRARGRERQMHALYETSRAVLKATRLEDAVESLLRRSFTLFHAETADFLLFSGSGLRTFSIDGVGAMRVTTRPPSPVELEAVYAIGDGDVVLADRGGEPMIRRLLTRAWDADGGLVGTVRSGHEPALLILRARRDRRRPYGPLDVETLRTLVAQVSTVLDRTRLLDAVERMQVLHETLQHRAEHDPLTGLANRHRLLDRLQQALASGRGDGVGVVYIDVDDFKPINDRHGHATGDAVLQTVALRLRGCLRDRDLAARVGGDEFVVLLDGIASEDVAREVASRIAESLDEPIIVAGNVLRVRASLGIATAARRAEDGQLLLTAADEEMYRAKREAKGRAVTRRPLTGAGEAGAPSA